MTYDVEAVRSHFPALRAAHRPLRRAGRLAGSREVARRRTRRPDGGDRQPRPGDRGRTVRRPDAWSAARQAMADLLGADPGGIVFGRSMTQLTFDFSRTLAKTWRAGDEVVVRGWTTTRTSGRGSWRPRRVGATVRWVDFDPETGELPPETSLACVRAHPPGRGHRRVQPDRHRPGPTGDRRLVHDAGALFYVDGVHLTAHARRTSRRSARTCSSARPTSSSDRTAGCSPPPGSAGAPAPGQAAALVRAVPERFELGTLPYELLAGTTAAVDFLAGLAPAPAGPRPPRAAGRRRWRG